jgi:hypothetical protein
VVGVVTSLILMKKKMKKKRKRRLDIRACSKLDPR